MICPPVSPVTTIRPAGFVKYCPEHGQSAYQAVTMVGTRAHFSRRLFWTATECFVYGRKLANRAARWAGHQETQ